MTSASILSEQQRTPDGKDRREGNPGAIYALINDGDQVHCMTEAMLDEWWNSLSPAEKAEFHECWLDAEPEPDASEGLPAIEYALRLMRDPLNQVVAAAEQLAAERQAMQLGGDDMPMFCATEIGLLRRHPCVGRKA